MDRGGRQRRRQVGDIHGRRSGAPDSIMNKDVELSEIPIANAVIYYNATILSSLYEHFQQVDPDKA